ncbi:hypothetical protein [Anabaena sp. CCY 9402-a]|uniref:hypothetical protein n=1 Tax=Anabaena sp. CCY 9402-a TaxID=3103867 RepID=UPI0039C6A403
MNRFQKLSSIGLLLLAFIYPPAMAEAKDSTQNHALNEQSIEAETNLVSDKSEELLLAHRRRRRHYYRRSRHRRHYYRRRNRHRRYYGQYYRHGRWQRVRDRHGRYIYHWRRY